MCGVFKCASESHATHLGVKAVHSAQECPKTCLSKNGTVSEIRGLLIDSADSSTRPYVADAAKHSPVASLSNRSVAFKKEVCNHYTTYVCTASSIDIGTSSIVWPKPLHLSAGYGLRLYDPPSWRLKGEKDSTCVLGCFSMIMGRSSTYLFCLHIIIGRSSTYVPQ